MSEATRQEMSVTFIISAANAVELGRVFTAIGAALAQVDVPSAVGSAPSDLGVDWYRARGTEFCERLQPTALAALRYIVQNGPTVPAEELRQITGKRGSALAGSLKSIGAAVSALGAPRAPFEVDHKRKVYRIDPEIQDALLTALSPNDPRRA